MQYALIWIFSMTVTDDIHAHATADIRSNILSAESISRQSVQHFVRLVIRSYEWELGGYTFVEIDSSGKVRHLDATLIADDKAADNALRPAWRLDTFDAGKDIVNQLVELIDETGFESLDTLYEDNVDDGIYEELLLQLSDHNKLVRCSNQFPDAAIRLKAFIHHEVLDKYIVPQKDAYPLTHDMAQPYWESVIRPDEDSKQ